MIIHLLNSLNHCEGHGAAGAYPCICQAKVERLLNTLAVCHRATPTVTPGEPEKTRINSLQTLRDSLEAEQHETVQR